jgi:hypothetical protein
VAERVFLHIGLPKTGTTYLQRALWHNKQALAEDGLLLPGRHQRRHLLASLDVRQDPSLAKRPGDITSPWADLVTESLAWDDDVLITHEFFGAASTEQAAKVVGSFPGAEVHAVLTARAMVELGISRWQEWVRNGARRSIDSYPPSSDYDPTDSWGWGSFDLGDVLERWGEAIPHERIHVLPMRPGSADPSELFERFLGVLGHAAAPVEMPKHTANDSLGVVETELLRRINRHLGEFRSPYDRGAWIRGFLASQKIMPSSSERFRPGPETLADLEARGRRSTEMLQTGGFDVVGDLALLEPSDLSGLRHPSEVSDAEQLEVATEVIAALLTEVRVVTRERNEALKERDLSGTRVSVARFVRGVARGVGPGRGSRPRKDSGS